jgi:hypothetical protein
MGTNFYKTSHEEPPGTFITDEESGTTLSSSSAPGWLVYAKFHFGLTNTTPGPGGGITETHIRSDVTELHLHTGLLESDQIHKLVLLSSIVNEAYGAENPQSPWKPQIVVSNQIGFTNISLLGSQLDANDSYFGPVAVNAQLNATPQVSGFNNYVFHVSLGGHKIVRLNRTYHPDFHFPSLGAVSVPSLLRIQAIYFTASLLLGKDNDAKIRDLSVQASTNSGSVYRSDDVPAYVEFRISDGPSNMCVYTGTSLPVFSTNFSGKQYFDLADPASAERLVHNGSSNLKIVNSINYNGPKLGLTALGAQPALTVLVDNAGPVTAAHEWGHSCGLDHRGLPQNPGPTEEAIMADPFSLQAKHINRFERDAMLQYQGP